MRAIEPHDHLFFIGRDRDAPDPASHLVVLEVRDWAVTGQKEVLTPPVIPQHPTEARPLPEKKPNHPT